MKTLSHRKSLNALRIWVLWAFAAAAVILPFDSLHAATPAETFAKVQSEVAADPKHAAAILKNELAALPPEERKRLAAGILAAVLKGLGNPPLAEALKLFNIAVDASPESVVALLDVAFGAYPASLLAFTEAAIKDVKAVGQPDLIPLIAAHAIALARDQRAAITALALSLAPESLGKKILDAITDLLAGHGNGGIPGSGALGGNINPANIGGSIVSPEQ